MSVTDQVRVPGHDRRGDGDNAPLFLVDGKPASVPLRDLPAVARKLVAHFADNVAPCSLRPGESLRGDVTEVTVRCLRIAIHLLDSGELPSDAELADLRSSAAQWARAGFRLEYMLRIYHEGIRLGWELVTDRAREGDVSSVADASRLWMALLEKVTVAATTGFVAELDAIRRERDVAAQELVTALLSGQDAAAVAQRSGLVLADTYTVLAVSLTRHPDERNPHVRPEVVARRTLRRVETELEAICEGRHLAMLGPEGGTVLLPESPSTEAIEEFRQRIETVAGVSVTIALVHAPVREVPTAAKQAHELLDLVRRLGRAVGAYGMQDLALEYQLTRPGPARRHLARVLDPLDESPELVETLETHIAHDLSRQLTAKTLHVHANTVDYRLKRVAQLTGFDPTRPSGLRQLQAALIARRLELESSEQG
ncbi:transcriptional regulator, CdaR family [Rhodococcus rhodochrous J3]|uniref:Helix-turn-helix domain-containing protein n=2 Tax=Rhodococcus rhodochrous TaxID=1829 RepID=A0AA46WYI6_RHORH|nr:MULTISPECIES: helix-turn-helix domain-containing protein [Rhodococcus]MDJ0399546.1 helix-turn-helix domain-containing protein [Rhodococcus rhodochrous]TWH52802.1 transcriptional regulator, CdaR family [Rhodococcus rhodochrous J38]UZF46442.1 helix-turn-helix domain-containing protein [Rhodococcus rhodochrous]WSE23960.1 helix-turn-helix domain-containing protein [Rhodococcus sp. PD04]SMG30563.1 transcriptional regulator, CdaR family [Rhodococcus rhodochrous J3]